MVWLNLKAKQKRDLSDHGYSTLGFLQAGSGKMELQGGNAGLNKEVARYGYT